MLIQNIAIAPGLLGLGIVGLLLALLFLYLYLRLWQRSRQLNQQFQMQQQSIEQSCARIHNGSLQMLAFLIRELQIHEVPQQDLLCHLRDLYQEILSNVQSFQD